MFGGNTSVSTYRGTYMQISETTQMVFSSYNQQK